MIDPRTTLLSALAVLTAACAAAAPVDEAPPRLGAPLATAERIYVGDWEGGVRALDRASGRLLWTRPFDSPTVFAPVIHGDLVIVADIATGLVALDADSGDTVWTFATGRGAPPEARDSLVNGAPEIVGGDLVFSSEDQSVYRIDAATGAELWRFTLPEEIQARHIPIADGVAFLGAWDGFLYAIDVETGALAWRSKTENPHVGEVYLDAANDRHAWRPRDGSGAQPPTYRPFVTAAPVIAGDAVIFATWAGDLLAVDRATGEQLWWFDPDTPDLPETGSRQAIAAHGGLVFYSTVDDRRLLAVDAATGAQAWERALDRRARGPLPLGGRRALVFFPGEGDDYADAAVAAFDMERLEFLWELPGVSGFFVENTDGGAVVLGFADGTVRRIDFDTGAELDRWDVTR